MKTHLINLIHQQIALILLEHSIALPNQNPNFSRRNRNRSKSQFLWCSAQDLLISFLHCLACFPSLLLFSSPEFSKTAVITGNLQGASQLDSCPLLTKCECVGVKKKKTCAAKNKRSGPRLLFVGLYVNFCPKRSIWEEWAAVQETRRRLGFTGIFIDH